MDEDIKAALQEMAGIDEDRRPQLIVHFDPEDWVQNNPMQHPEVYKLNHDQLLMWAEEITEIRRLFMQKAERYDTFVQPPKTAKKKRESRKSIPHSTRKCNPEGLLEE